jgi:Protein of unknown function (DUF1302)
MRTPAGWLVLALAVVLSAESASFAYFLDKGRNFDVRLRAYSQLGIMTDSSETDWPGNGPNTCVVNGKESNKCKYSAGDLAQHRNFYNPEFDAKLTDYTRWMNGAGLSLIAPDEFKFRFAWWGFYDGVYDYLNGPWNFNRQNLKARQSQSNDIRKESFVFNDENKNARHIYAQRNRINELYLDYKKGPLFLRAGRQSISWGESDDIVFMDRLNAFDLTLGAPGLFQDLDEARIPFWALRGTYKLLDSWNFLSSVFADAFVVPGVIDTTVPIDPMVGGVSPFSPDVADPQLMANDLIRRNGFDPRNFQGLHLVVVTHQPENDWSNTRWGTRLTGVVARDYTVQAWFAREFPVAPTPLLTGGPGAFDQGFKDVTGRPVPITLIDDRGFKTPVCLDNSGKPVTKRFGAVGRTPSGRTCSWAEPIVTILDRKLESVFGVSATWYSQMVNGIIRTEAEYFKDEEAVIPNQNLNPLAQVPRSILKNGALITNTIPRTDYLRWLVGYDRFFFFRPLNPSNSFIFVAAIHGETNIFERRERDFRTAQVKPGKQPTEFAQQPICSPVAIASKQCRTAPAKNFEDLKAFDNDYLSIALLTDYMHGRLEPRIVALAWASGIFGFQPMLTYRVNDNLLLSATYIAIESSRRAILGTFRAHDMAQLRMTFQLN